MTEKEQRLISEIQRLRKQIEEMANPTILMYRTLTEEWPDTPELNLFKATWALGSFKEDWEAALALSNVRQ